MRLLPAQSLLTCVQLQVLKSIYWSNVSGERERNWDHGSSSCTESLCQNVGTEFC